MNDTALMAAYAELREIVLGPNIPEGVLDACCDLSQHQTKLFVTTFSLDTALANEVCEMHIVPSNFLNKLLAALRASEWFEVLLLIKIVCR